MNVWDYLIIAVVLIGFIASIYYMRRTGKHGCSACCDSNCPLSEGNRGCQHPVAEGKNDETSGGCEKLP